MAASKRTLAAFAAGALLVPLSPFASPASADHITFRTIENACPEGQVSQGRYEDVPEDSGAFETEINCVSDYGIATGRQTNDFDRELNVTRRQLAQFVYREARLGGVQFDTTTDPGYNDDNDVTGEARDAIFGLTNAGVLRGVGGGRFDPNGNVRRDQMATFLVGLAELLELQGFETTQDFFTDDETSVHEANINRIASEGVTQGQGGDRIYGPFNAVLRQQMAAFLARVLDIAVEQGAIESIFQTPAPDATVTVNNTTVQSGQQVTGTITANEGNTIQSVTVSGCGLNNQNVTLGNNGSFTLTIPQNQQAGQCTLTFTTTFQNDEDGNAQTDTDTVQITVTTPPGATEQPELVDAAIVNTTSQGEQSPTNPLGTTVRFTFDENISNAGGLAPRPLNFLVYNANGTLADNGSSVVSVSGNQVVILFDAVQTDEAAATLTLATVDVNAVTDAQGDTNPEGDAALGTQGGGNTTLPAGITTAPDLQTVGGFRQGAGTGQTAVDFTFDENAFVVTPGGFRVILNDGTDLQCAGPTVGSQTAGGGTTAGGNGTTTITVICQAANGQILTANDVARGTVDPGTVSDTAQDTTNETVEGETNVRQAAQVGNGGNTIEPDLVSVQVRPGATAGDNDQALFTFDQNVAANPAAAQFFLYTPDAPTTQQGQTAQTNPNNQTQVLVTFASTTIAETAVGGFVEDGAVQSTTTPALANEQDEEGFANTQTQPGQTPGRTDAPDLTGVNLFQPTTTDPFGNPTAGDFQATYTFDEDVEAPVAGEFRLYLADGTPLTATTCAVTQPTGDQTTEDVDNSVTCTDFGTATSEQVGNAVLGTVDNGAVNEEGQGALTNPEGAEFTSGGTGTRTA